MYIFLSASLSNLDGTILLLLYIISRKVLCLIFFANNSAILYNANTCEKLKIKMKDDLSNATGPATIKLSINHEKMKPMLIKSKILLDDLKM
jgi:succinylarginine dihydrolase